MDCLSVEVQKGSFDEETLGVLNLVEQTETRHKEWKFRIYLHTPKTYTDPENACHITVSPEMFSTSCLCLKFSDRC